MLMGIRHLLYSACHMANLNTKYEVPGTMAGSQKLKNMVT